MQPSEPRSTTYTEAERQAILDQLERMLANPLFRHSKRYPRLLRYVVERTIEGCPGDLKERTIGIEVFGREPNYDTNADPIVRAAAGEVRKRIAQYYYENGHESEVRIDLTPGSYVPEFILNGAAQAVTTVPPAEQAPVNGTKPQVEVTLSYDSPTVTKTGEPERTRRWAYLAAYVAATALLVTGAWYKPWRRHGAVDAFWNPVLDCSRMVRVCVGQRRFLGVGQSSPLPQHGTADGSRDGAQATPDPSLTLFDLYYQGSQNVAFPDVVTLGRLTGLLEAKGRGYFIRSESTATFEELREGPVVLVGAFNNDWTMRLTRPMRFSFTRDKDLFVIADRMHPDKRKYAISYQVPYMNVTEDYALISRVRDPITERMVVVAGGLTGYGTIAAGEFLTTNSYLDGLAKSAPSGWESKNLQVVIATKVINGNSGPPRVVEQYYW